MMDGDKYKSMRPFYNKFNGNVVKIDEIILNYMVLIILKNSKERLSYN